MFDKVETPPPLLLRISEVMKLFGVSRASVDRWAAAGLVHRVKIGPRAARITAESVRARLVEVIGEPPERAL